MTSEDEFDDLEGSLEMFKEPKDFLAKEKEHTFQTHILQSGTQLRLRLVGHNPLWVRTSLYITCVE